MLDGQWSKVSDPVSRQKFRQKIPRATAQVEDPPEVFPHELDARLAGQREQTATEWLSRAEAPAELGWADSEADSRQQRQRLWEVDSMQVARQLLEEDHSRQQRQHSHEAAGGPFAVGRHALDSNLHQALYEEEMAPDARFIGQEFGESPSTGKAYLATDSEEAGWTSSSIVEAGASVWGAFFGGAATVTAEKRKEQARSSASMHKNRGCAF